MDCIAQVYALNVQHKSTGLPALSSMLALQPLKYAISRANIAFASPLYRAELR